MIEETYKQAVAAYRSGRFAEAEAMCGGILRGSPDHFDALHLSSICWSELRDFTKAKLLLDRALEVNPRAANVRNSQGNLYEDLGRPEDALVSYVEAVTLKPDFAAAWFNRGNVLRKLGRLEEAVSSYGQVLELEPGNAFALYNRGLALQGLDRLTAAETCYARAAELRPNYAEAHNNRGNVLLELGQPDAALVSYDRALVIKPNYAIGHNNRGKALRALHRLDEAMASHDQAVALKPDFAEAYFDRGQTQRERGRLEDALSNYDQALKLIPDSLEILTNRGNVLEELKRLEEALVCYDRAIAIDPNYADTHYNRGIVLLGLQRPRDALASYDQAISLNPSHAKAHSNRGNVLMDLKRFDEALVSYDRAIELNPEYAETYGNRGLALFELKRIDESLISYDMALALNPELAYLLGLWLHAKNYLCNWDQYNETSLKIIRAIENDEKANFPFPVMAMASSAAVQRRCAKIYIQDKFPVSSNPTWRGERYRHDKIRVGYFSSDFGEHPVSYLSAGLFECHDRSRFEVVAFFTGKPSGDGIQQRLRKAFDQFIDVEERSDREVAQLAKEMEIDIAVDMNGHTSGARTGVFALRPAPIQVNYLGYPGTLGAEYMDYIIADRTVIPVEHQADYTEHVVYLPHTFQVNDSSKVISDKQISRSGLGLPEDGFVFCCFNNNYKITPDIFAAWMRLLKQVPGSVLWLQEGSATVVGNLKREAQQQGVSPDRLVFAKRLALADYLAQYRLADLFLDTWYYNAGTTASDALWAGLPVLTCLGQAFAGRMAASLLNAIGLPELITNSHEEYESLALALARDRVRLTSAKGKLARHRTTYPLFDTALFTKHLEAAYSAMWGRYQAGLPPDIIQVEV